MASDSSQKARGGVRDALTRAAIFSGVLLLGGLYVLVKGPTSSRGVVEPSSWKDPAFKPPPLTGTADAPSRTSPPPLPPRNGNVDDHVLASPQLVGGATNDHRFAIGDRVRMRDSKPPWSRGIITSTDPLLVQKDGFSVSFPYKRIEPLSPEALAAELAAPKEVDGDPECWMWAKLGRCAERNLTEVCSKSCRLAQEGEAGRVLRADGVAVTPDNLAMVRHLIDVARNGYDDARHTVYDAAAQELPWHGVEAAGRHLHVAELRTSEPRVLLLADFLSAEEVEYVVALAAQLEFTASPTYDASGGFQRSSSTVFLEGPEYASDAVLTAVTRRAAAVCGSPVAAVEPLQLLRYQPGEFYKPHLDGASGTEREFTILVYLTDVPHGMGGRSRFPLLGASVVPRAGAAIFWQNSRHDPDERYCREYRSLHDSEPLVAGMKLAMNIWVRLDGYYKDQ